jgi:putative transposase
MARPLRIEYPGAFYHITSRGNERKDIFKSQRDREKFLSYLASASERYQAVIHVFCMLGNHYHLLMETPKGNLSQIMRHINGAYTTYINVKRNRSGHLFQGRYKAILVEKDEYAKELSRYIHLNPVRAGIVERPEKYPWSSYRYYIGLEKKPDWLVTDFILSYFGKRVSKAQKRYREFVKARIGQKYDTPLKETVASIILGSSGFIREIKERHIQKRKRSRDLPALRKFSPRLSVEKIRKEVGAVLEGDVALAEGVSVYFSHRYSGETLKEIGTHFGIGESAVSQRNRRFALKLGKDNKLRKKIKGIESRLKLSRV